MSAGAGDTGSLREAPFFDQGLFLLHLNRGKEEMKKGRWEDARYELREAQRFRSRDAEVVASLAFTQFHLGEFAEAERLTREVLGTHPGSVALLFNLGLILFKSGRSAAARDSLEKVLAAAPGHRKAHLTLGLVLQRLGEPDRAREHLRRAGADGLAGEQGDDTVSRTARAAAGLGPGPVRRDHREVTSPIVKPESFGVDARVSTAPVPVLARSPLMAPPVSPPLSPGEESRTASAPTSTGTGAPPSVPFSPASGGFLSAATSCGLVVLRSAIVGRRGVPDLSPLAGPGVLAPLLVRAAGEGTLLLLSRGRRPFLHSLGSDFLAVDPARLLGFTASLSFREDPAFEFRRDVELPFLKLYGEGVVALAVTGDPALFKATEEEPLTLATASVLGYGGTLRAELLEDADPLAYGPGPILRFTGIGTVLADGG